jgi:hypothetical protein
MTLLPGALDLTSVPLLLHINIRKPMKHFWTSIHPFPGKSPHLSCRLVFDPQDQTINQFGPAIFESHINEDALEENRYFNEKYLFLFALPAGRAYAQAASSRHPLHH